MFNRQAGRQAGGSEKGLGLRYSKMNDIKSSILSLLNLIMINVKMTC